MKPFPHPWDIAEPQAKRDIVLAAVANDGFALSHASDALRADREAPTGTTASTFRNSGQQKLVYVIYHNQLYGFMDDSYYRSSQFP